MYGFGGKVNGQVQHCFALNQDNFNPDVQGLDGMLSVYRQALMSCQLSGPTLFSQVLQRVVTKAEEEPIS